MTDGFKRLTEEDECPVCDRPVQLVVEKTVRGVQVRHDDYDVHEEPEMRKGLTRYYLHLNN